MTCPSCQSSNLIQLPGVPPHAARERCLDCGRESWVPKWRALDPEALARNEAEYQARRDAERLPLFGGGQP